MEICEEEFTIKLLNMCTLLQKAIQYSKVVVLIFLILLKLQGVVIWYGAMIKRCFNELEDSVIMLKNGNHRVGFWVVKT